MTRRILRAAETRSYSTSSGHSRPSTTSRFRSSRGTSCGSSRGRSDQRMRPHRPPREPHAPRRDGRILGPRSRAAPSAIDSFTMMRRAPTKRASTRWPRPGSRSDAASIASARRRPSLAPRWHPSSPAASRSRRRQSTTSSSTTSDTRRTKTISTRLPPAGSRRAARRNPRLCSARHCGSREEQWRRSSTAPWSSLPRNLSSAAPPGVTRLLGSDVAGREPTSPVVRSWTFGSRAARAAGLTYSIPGGTGRGIRIGASRRERGAVGRTERVRGGDEGGLVDYRVIR